MTKICRICNAQFEASHGNRKICSAECRVKSNALRGRKWRKDRIKSRGKSMKKKIEGYTRRCLDCGETLPYERLGLKNNGSFYCDSCYKHRLWLHQRLQRANGFDITKPMQTKATPINRIYRGIKRIYLRFFKR